MFCQPSDLETESDVEQKVVWPLLTGSPPIGLGYQPVDIKTKPNIRRLTIGKGTTEKLYFPDHVIVVAGIPVFIIEVKNPDEDPVSALRESRMYGNEINAAFRSGITPCIRVVATNGKVIVSSPVDQTEPDITLTLENISVASPLFASFAELLSRKAAQAHADRIRNSLTARPLKRPLQFLGGQSTRDDDVGYNELGSHLVIDYRHVFNPESRKERAHIVRNAYVPSQRREHYVDEIDRIIKTAVYSTVHKGQTIENTEVPTEFLNVFRAGRTLENEIMLLVGGRGAGKSTFVDYCREVKLPPDLVESTLWVHLNLNDAPSEQVLLERWLLDEISNGLRREHADFDFDDLETVLKVFSVEVNRLKKGPLALLDPQSEGYRTRIADQLMTLQADPLAHAKAMCRCLGAERGKLLVVVFDNCDKREKDEQLQTFQSARWLQQQIRSLVILPVRDVTYETYRDQPPLDTMIKDLVFRIDPPSFPEILRKRLAIIMSELSIRTNAKMLRMTLENGLPVDYPATDLGFYLASIFRSIYQYDRMIRSLVLGLAGRDVRRAMEIFLEFCRSGHIGAKEYWKIKVLKGEYSLPFHVVARVLLRRNRRFYDGDVSFLKNLFQCNPEDPRPDVFVRADILEWLKAKFREPGPTGVKGFHQCKLLIGDLMPLGHDTDAIRRELAYLVKHGCILTEHQRGTIQSDEDLVRISPSGHVHLGLVNDINYLAACAEETWTESEPMAGSIARRIAYFGPKVHYSPVTTAANAAEFVAYLKGRADRDGIDPNVYLDSGFSGVRLDADAVAERAKRTVEKEKAKHGWDDFEDNFSVGMECAGTVDGMKDFGIFVRLDGGPTGLVYFKNLPPERQLSSFKVGDRIVVTIREIQTDAKKVSLAYVQDEVATPTNL